MGRQKQDTSRLTDAEIALIRLLADGMTNKEIANRLCYSEKTVKNYLMLIFRKIQVTDRLNALVWAIRHGLVVIGPQVDYPPVQTLTVRILSMDGDLAKVAIVDPPNILLQ
jgi:DNA-binding CsgD family transcriptional regulator